MHRDSDAFHNLANSEALQQSILAWLFQKPIPSGRPPTEDSFSPVKPPGDDFVENLEATYLDPLDSEDIKMTPLTRGEGEPGVTSLYESRLGGDRPLRPGEIPAVQDRFYALVKRRLQTEIQHHPPLFPWETQILDYEPETLDFPVEEQVPALVWTAQLPSLSLPVSLPTTVLVQILERCRMVVQSSLREGAKLVRAVEPLFPERSGNLNQLAGLVMQMSPTRGPSVDAINRVSKAAGEFPRTYEAATPAQQMVLCLLAAREIMGTLTLTVYTSGEPVERQCQTGAGMLSVRVEYVKTPVGLSTETEFFASMRVQAQLPCGGTVQLHSGETQATACRPNAGVLSVEVFDPQPNETYFLEVRFQNQQSNSLTFVVCPKTEAER